MPREDDIRRIVQGGRQRGLGDDQIRALVARYDARQSRAAETRPPAPARPSAGMSEEQWAGMSAGEKMRNVLQWGGKAIAGMTGIDRSAVESPTLTLAGAVAPAVAKPVLTSAGKVLYKGGTALLPKTLKQQYPNIAARGFEEGVALTKRGADKAGALATQSRQQADTLIAAAEKGGASPVTPREVVREFRPVAQKMRNQTALGLPNDTPALAQRAKAFASQNQGGIPLTKAQALKREAQDLADTAYKARDRGAVINSMEALTNESQARGLRAAIERRVPAVGPVNARTQELMGVLRGAEHASGTGHVLSRLGGVGAGAVIGSSGGTVPALAAAGAGSMLTTPSGLTAAGIGLKRVGQAVDAKALRAALMALLANQQGGSEP